MKKIFSTLIIVFGITLVVAGIVLWIYPQWSTLRGWWLILIGVVFVSVAEIGGKLKDWRDFLFEDKKQDKTNTTNQSLSIDVSDNLMMGKNKVKVRKNNSRVSNNSMIGENEIEIGASEPKKKKGK